VRAAGNVNARRVPARSLSPMYWGVVLAAVIAAGPPTIFGYLNRRKITEVHVLVNSNLTAVTEALARKTAEALDLESQNATLRGEPSSTVQLHDSTLDPPAPPAPPVPPV
jgi:hypothetical protein